MMSDESADIRTTIMEDQKRSPPPPRQMRRRRERQQQQQQGRLRRRHQYDHIKFVVLFVIVYTSLLLRQDSTSPHDSSAATTSTISSSDALSSSNFHRRQLMQRQEQQQQQEQPRTLKKKKHLPLDGDYSSFPCDSLYEIPESVRCDFVQTCNDGDGLFVQSIFCSSSTNTSFRTRLLIWSTPLLLFLIVLFRILGSTAEEFFSPGLEMLSIKLHFPERFAGVTLLSLGNGAPDVASTVSALMHDRKQGYLLALGELTGASMVASTVIVGAVTYHSISPVVCQGALIRDVVMFVITMITVYFAFDDGSIDVGEIRTFLVLYFAYVLIVLAADIYQKSRRHPRPIGRADSIGSEKDSPDEATALLQTPSKDQDIKRNRSHSIGSYELGLQNEQVRPAWERGNSWDALTDYSQPIFNRVIRHISNYNEVSLSSRREGDNNVGHDFDIAAGDDDDKQNDKQRQQQFTHEKHHSDPLYRQYSDQAKAAGWGDIDNYETEPLMVFHPHHGGIVDLKHSSLLHTGRRLSLTDEGSEEETTPEARISVWRELVDYFANFWNETFFSDEYNIIEKFLMVCELPATILRLLTIPVPCDGYYCRSLLAFSTVLCPFWLWYYLSAQFDVNIVGDLPWVLVLLILAALLVLGFLILRYAPCGEIPPRLSVAVPIVLVGFVASAAWLDYVADKIVSLLDFFGIICGIPSTIMGLTVLAWGNASQDLVANMTVAHKGLSTMAITACFAGPVCTMLIGLGLGLFVLNSARPGKEIVVHLNNTLRIGFLFCVLNGVLVIVSGVFVGRGIIPKKYGIIAAVLYFLYVVASLSF